MFRMNTDHGLNTVEVQDVVLKQQSQDWLSVRLYDVTYSIAVVNDRPDTSLDDSLKVGPRVSHPIASACKIVINRVTSLLPVTFCADLRLQRRAAKVR